MPPHCDSMDGPVVKAAIKGLEAENVDLVLPFVKDAGEEEVRKAFARAIQARKVPDGREGHRNRLGRRAARGALRAAGR